MNRRPRRVYIGDIFANHYRAGLIGLMKDSDRIIDISFDILSLEALFLVPRYLVCSATLEVRGILNSAGRARY